MHSRDGASRHEFCFPLPSGGVVHLDFNRRPTAQDWQTLLEYVRLSESFAEERIAITREDAQKILRIMDAWAGSSLVEQEPHLRGVNDIYNRLAAPETV